jgi:predicted nucleotidyltransferase
MARDIILTQGYGIDTGRATQDIDLGVQVSDWHGYERLTEGLIAAGEFRRDKKQAQRFDYKEMLSIDVIPFGAIAEPDYRLSWPPQYDTTMSTLGFGAAFKNSISLKIRAKPPLHIKFVSLSGLALLKIISWKENHVRRGKDAHDLLLLMQTYLDAGNQERLFNDESDLVGEDFDYVQAGSRLLGRDIAGILSQDIIETLVKILDKETGDQNHYGLIEDMLDRGAEGSDFENALQLLENLKAGILEKC